MPPSPNLRILCFPQRVAGRRLDVHVLLIPTQGLLNDFAPVASNLNPGTSVNLPKFIQGNVTLESVTIKGLSSYPFSDGPTLATEGVTVDHSLSDIAFPANIQSIYEGVRANFKVKDTDTTPRVPRAASDGIRKYLPQSYRTRFNFTTPRTQFARIDDSYHCAIKKTGDPDPGFRSSHNDIPWGRVIALCLRQPLLAEKMGLLYRTHVNLPVPDYFSEGGWVYFRLTSDPAALGLTNADVQAYAARIPFIDDTRQLFAAVLFPVVPTSASLIGQYDQLKIEAADYDDGFAKIVHVAQPVSANIHSEQPDGIHVQKEIGFRMGWDDEQVLIWQNRAFLSDPTTPGSGIAPLGVFSYRVDVTQDIGKAKQTWNSLVKIRSTEELFLEGESIAPANTEIETGVQVYPSRINADLAGAFWLPAYFTQWYGASLVLPDSRAAELDETGSLGAPGSYQDGNIQAHPEQKGNLYEPVLPKHIQLKYGQQYEFRVRLADLTGGGPKHDDDELNDAPATSATQFFRRFVAPKQVKVVPQAAQPNPGGPTAIFLAGTAFDIFRPRLGYPALLFTEMDSDAAFQKLLDDKKFLHTGKAAGEKIKEQREISYFDPDVDQFMVQLDVRTLSMDNLASRTQREAFIPLYRTFRKFPKTPDRSFTLNLEYRDAHVIDFGNEATLGDLGISQKQIDAAKNIVLPTSRDVRITLFSVASDKPDLPEYFGFAKTAFGDEFVRTGEPVQFYVRQDATEEPDFFLPSLLSKDTQGIYLRPDPVQVINPQTLVSEFVAGKEAEQSTIVDRLAAQLGLQSKGLSLVGNPGERIHFGCGRAIRHTLAPDGSSLTFAASDSLINHWICVLSMEINRDWTWDGLEPSGIEIIRTRQFTGEADTIEEASVGSVELKKAASRLAITGPDRSRTRVVFIDAVEPKKEPGKQANPFPNTIHIKYQLTPHFISAVTAASAKKQMVSRELDLPVTTIPAQVPVVVAAGMALSPYIRKEDYSETAVRQRYLWLEFKDPVLDPNDTYFARVLTYAPDPLLSFPSPGQLLVKQDDPPLDIPPELIRVITAGQGNDNAGLDAMQRMSSETVDPAQPLIAVTPVHYLLPLPPGLHGESPELFGFFSYEIRVGHTEKIWSTAQGRFGHPLRLNGVQHPAPPLQCLVDRTPDKLSVGAEYAVALFGGRDVTSRPPKTEIWALLYAQVAQADGTEPRNLLLDQRKLDYQDSEVHTQIGSFLASRTNKEIQRFNSFSVAADRKPVASSFWTEDALQSLLRQFGLSPDTRLSVLAVELMPRYEQYVVFGPEPQPALPLSRDLGRFRILRASRLVAAPEICCPDCV